MSYRIITLFSLFVSIMNAQSVSIEYSLGMSNPSSHVFEVTISIGNLPSGRETLDFIIPAWRPGRYEILDFSSGIISFAIEGQNGEPLPWRKTDKNTWRVETKNQKRLTIRYEVYANEFAMRTRGLNSDHGFVNGAAVFMYPSPYRFSPMTLRVLPPRGWHVTTGLDEVAGEQFLYRAEDYDHLADSPLEIGTQADTEFDVAGKKHILSIFGTVNADREKVARGLTAVINEHIAIFGKLPYERYVFLVHAIPYGGGGTEHRNSTIMGTQPAAFDSDEGLTGFLTLAAHEFFHTWNVKQYKPKAFSPPDYIKENYTRELWIAEGATSYYDDLIMTRAGFRSAQWYEGMLGGRITGDRSRPGNSKQSIAESSFDAWVKFWKQTEHSFNTESNYYSRGADVNLLLDLEIRAATSNKKSLDDVHRLMFEKFPPTGAGYTNDDYRALCEQIAGRSFREFFDSYVEGTKPLPWEETLRHAGLEVSADTTPRPWFGAMFAEQNGRLFVRDVIAGSPAAQGGLSVGDEILALNGQKLSQSEIASFASKQKSGDTVLVTHYRMNQLRQATIVLANNPVPAYKVSRTPSPTPLQKAMYEGWLKKKWE